MSGTQFGTWGRRQDLHTSPEIQWSRCDGCPEMTCKHHPEMRLPKNQWTYYCNGLATELTRKEIYDMTKRKCPIGRGLKRGRRNGE